MSIMKKIFLLLTLFISTQSFSQETNYDIEEQDAFQPMFSLGSGYYNSLGDIKGPDGNYLLGNMGINTGIRINLTEELDLSFLFNFNAKLHEKSETEYFEADLNSLGFNLDYTFNNILENTKISPFATTGAQWMYYTTTINNTKLSQETGINIPIGLGISLDVSERIRFDAGINYHLSFADIDHATTLSSNDNFTVVNFTMHYDLFSKKPEEYNEYDESKYRNVNFKAIEVRDNDKDGVADINDECPDTPKKAKVDDKGCPLDTDNDGVPNYLDKEPNTKEGAVVNSQGVQLTDEEYNSMYSEYESASREFAKFYNESEIKRDNYKSDNEYLIAKANAFNKKYNSLKNGKSPIGRKYLVEIGRFQDNIPSYLINKLLSYEDLQSIPYEDENGKTLLIYAVGGYDIIDDAENRESILVNNDGLSSTNIIVLEDGNVSYHKYINTETINKESLLKESKESEEVAITNINSNTSIDKKENVEENIEKTIYRIQVGAYQRPLSFNIFEGIDVIPIVTGNMTRYYVGSDTKYERSLMRRDEMKARGFEDAFIVVFKNGERINIYTPTQKKKNKIKKESNLKEIDLKEDVINEKQNITFYVQIGVWMGDVNEDTQSKIDKIGKVEKILIKGKLYKYIAGNYNDLSDAKNRVSQVRSDGFPDAFIFAEKDGERVTIKEAIQLLKN